MSTCLSVVIPAFNEEATLVAVAHRILAIPHLLEVVIVDDCSTDDTPAVASALGVTLLTPPRNTGSKAGAQSFALPRVRTPYTMAIDADTTLAPDAIEMIMPAFGDPDVAAVCGFVLPRFVRTIWERGRYVEYLFAFTFYKQVQEYYERPLISSGCFSAYRTDALRAQGGWSTRTLAEDMDLTWSLYQGGHKVRFVPDAVCYPIEPHSYAYMRKQLKRWSHGFLQNVRLHWRGLLDVPAVLVPVAVGAAPRREIGRALASVPSFLILRTVNALFFLNAAWNEWVLRRTFRTYEKGH